jgi:hypothetical protein
MISGGTTAKNITSGNGKDTLLFRKGSRHFDPQPEAALLTPEQTNRSAPATCKSANNVICFGYNTHIMTDHGDCPVQSLNVGSRVITRDHGMQKVRWIGSHIVPAIDNMAPVLFKRGIFNTTRDLVVSPGHRMLFKGAQAELMFGQSEVLMTAKQLLGNDGVYQAVDGFVEYFHILFDRHEIIYAEGVACESCHLDQENLTALGETARNEIFETLPYLRTTPNAYGPTARACLNDDEAALLKI